MAAKVAFILTNSGDVTSDYLCDRLAKGEIPYVRFDTDTSLQDLRLTFGPRNHLLSWGRYKLSPSDVSTIVLRRPEALAPQCDGDKAQQMHAAAEWAEALEGFLAHVPIGLWMNHGSVNFNACHKLEQLSRARASGLLVPDFLATTDPDEAEEFINDHEHGVVAKPLASGYLERDNPEHDSVLFTVSISSEHVRLLPELSVCPVLFQEMIQKSIDVRLVVVDGEMTAVGLSAHDGGGRQRLDIRRNNMDDVQYAIVDIPSTTQQAIRTLMKSYGLRFAAIDLAVDVDGRWVFFEVNPNGQWAWLDIDGGADIGEMFVSALRRAALR